MAPRTRVQHHRYGGEMCGLKDNVPQFINAYNKSHTCIDETHPGPPYRTGGPLTVIKTKVSIGKTSSVSITRGPNSYKGYLWVTPHVPSTPTAAPLTGWGAIGWNRTQPLHPIYQLGVSIGELKDLPGMLKQTRRGFRALANAVGGKPPRQKTVGSFLASIPKGSKDAGDTFLYGAFGLAPMLQDLLFLMKMREKLEQKMAYLKRNNGKPIRRKMELKNESYSEDVPRSGSPLVTMNPGLRTEFYDFTDPTMVGGQSLPIRKSYSHRIWYAARYRYMILELQDWSPGKPLPRGLALDLLGLAPDPSIIYNLIPWSWLLDWFTSAGDVVSNIYARAKYHLVADYAYVMSKEDLTYIAPGHVVVNTGTYTLGPGWSGKPEKVSGASSTSFQFRSRGVANPYGFGITYASLSGYQWSILAALGMSRGSGSVVTRP